jgi:hypothetical protein
LRCDSGREGEPEETKESVMSELRVIAVATELVAKMKEKMVSPG